MKITGHVTNAIIIISVTCIIQYIQYISLALVACKLYVTSHAHELKKLRTAWQPDNYMQRPMWYIQGKKVVGLANIFS